MGKVTPLIRELHVVFTPRIAYHVIILSKNDFASTCIELTQLRSRILLFQFLNQGFLFIIGERIESENGLVTDIFLNVKHKSKIREFMQRMKMLNKRNLMITLDDDLILFGVFLFSQNYAYYSEHRSTH